MLRRQNIIGIMAITFGLYVSQIRNENVIQRGLRYVTWQTWEKRITFVTLRCR